jgi:hypothetical protein
LSISTPVGLYNDGSYCYAAAMLQNLFHLPNVREAIFLQGNQIEGDNQVEFATACLFARMQNSTRPVHPEWDFYPAFQTSVNQLGFGLRPRQSDDSQAFFTWMVEAAMPWMSEYLFSVQYRIIDSFEGIVFKNQSLLANRQINAIVNIWSGMPGVMNIQALLEPQFEDIDGYKLSRTGNARIDEQLLHRGVQFDLSTNMVTRRVSIDHTGPILAIHVARMWDFSDRETVTHYTDQLLIGGCNYHLIGMIIAHPGHYSAMVQTNVFTEQWHHLNDASVTRVSKSEILSQGHRVFMLFYVKESEIINWKADSNLYNQTPSREVISRNRDLMIQRYSKL